MHIPQPIRDVTPWAWPPVLIVACAAGGAVAGDGVRDAVLAAALVLLAAISLLTGKLLGKREHERKSPAP